MVQHQSPSAGPACTLGHTGLKPTRRQGRIVLLFLVLLCLIFVRFSAIERRTGLFPAVPVAVLCSPWLAGLLLILLDRPGPVRNWLGPLFVSLFYPALCFYHDWNAVNAWLRRGTPPNWSFSITLNAVLLGGFAVYLARMAPRHCPRCRRRSLIPLQRLTRQEKRSVKTHWCAACGATLWKDREGRWQPERRRTWLDAAEPHPEAMGSLGVETP
jgi:hypothetical protein